MPALAGKLLGLLLMVSVLANCADAPSTPSAPAETLATRLNTLLTNAAKGEKFSGAVLVAHGSQIVLSKGYGGSNTALTHFQIGSLTKQFTAFAVMILQERGKLRVLDQLCLYMPACPSSWRSITLHHLLTNSSGIAIPNPQGTAPASPEQLIARYQAKALDFVPGTRSGYSNVGYQMLGYIIQRVSGLSYTDFIKDAILTPLHMSATGFVPQDVDEQSPAWAFTLAPGGLYATVEDMHRWDQEIAAPTLISQQTLETIMTPYIGGCGQGCPPRFQKTRYGYGWYISQEQRGEVFWYMGEANGYESYNSHYSTSNVDIIILTDSDLVFEASYGLILIGTIEDLTFAYLHS